MLGAIGDALLSSAIIEDLRHAFPTVRLVAFVSAANSSTLDLLEGPDVVVTIPVAQPYLAVAAVRRHKLDVLIDVGQWPRISALIVALAGARFTVGFKTQWQGRHWAFDSAVEHSAHCHELDNFRALLGALGVTGRSMPRFKAELLKAASLLDVHPYVVFHPWASGYRYYLREWSAENWIALADVVAKHGYHVVITGGPQDRARAKSLAAAAGHPSAIVVLAGRTNLRQSTITLLHAAAVVSVNTGIMHVAALLNRPTLALHGPTSPHRWGPIGSSSIVIGPGPECGCGYLNLGFEYPASPPDCMSKITVQQVTERLAAMLGWCHTAPDTSARVP